MGSFFDNESCIDYRGSMVPICLGPVNILASSGIGSLVYYMSDNMAASLGVSFSLTVANAVIGGVIAAYYCKHVGEEDSGSFAYEYRAI